MRDRIMVSVLAFLLTFFIYSGWVFLEEGRVMLRKVSHKKPPKSEDDHIQLIVERERTCEIERKKLLGWVAAERKRLVAENIRRVKVAKKQLASTWKCEDELTLNKYRVGMTMLIRKYRETRLPRKNVDLDVYLQGMLQDLEAAAGGTPAETAYVEPLPSKKWVRWMYKTAQDLKEVFKYKIICTTYTVQRAHTCMEIRSAYAGLRNFIATSFLKRSTCKDKYLVRKRKRFLMTDAMLKKYSLSQLYKLTMLELCLYDYKAYLFRRLTRIRILSKAETRQGFFARALVKISVKDSLRLKIYRKSVLDVLRSIK